MKRHLFAQQGFTLIEAIVVVAMVGVLLALAAPSFVNFTSSQKVKTASFDLYAALLFARSEAIKRRQTVTVTPMSADWKNGWVVTTPDPAIVPIDPAITITLRNQDALSGVVTSGAASVAYRLDGRLNGGATVGVLIRPQTADASIPNRCIRVDLTGLPKTTQIPDTNCP
jgi:type IV fimbrial biogenesis protein FimT